MPKPKIAIVTTYMDRRPAKGTAIVIRKLVEGLRAHTDEFDITLVHEQPIPEDPLYQSFREIVIPQKPFPKFRRFLSEVWFFLTTKERFDIWYQPYSRLYPLFWMAPAKHFMFMPCDGGPLTAGYTGAAKGYFPWYIQAFFSRVRIFVTVSFFGKKGIMDVYHLPDERVQVIYNGVDAQFQPVSSQEEKANVQADLLRRYGIRTPYILDVSRFDPHKNIIRVLESYKKLIDERHIPHTLVFVGGRHMPDYSQQVDQRIAELRLQDRVVVTPFVPDEDLPRLYQGSELLFFPSLYEGFGLPVVEAMRCGIPVIGSTVGSLPEVVGEAGVLVDPYSVEDMSRGLWHVLMSSLDERERMIQMGYSQSKQFSWEKSTQQTVGIFRRLLSS